MSAGYKSQYVDALEQHQDLMQAHSELLELGSIMGMDDVEGSEALKEAAMDSLSSVGRGLFSVSKWVGGKAIDGFIRGMTTAGNQLNKSFNDNQGLIKNVLKDAGKVADKDIQVTGKKIGLITATGNPDRILHDMELLVKDLEVVEQHAKDLIGFLDRELVTLKQLKSAKKSEDIHKVIDAFNELEYPVMKFADRLDKAYKSEVLPGGRFFLFKQEEDDKPAVYSIGGEPHEGEGVTLNLSKTEVTDILNKLGKVNALHLRVKASYESYLGFIKSWAEMVKGVDGNLSQLDQVSKTVIGEAEKLMAGNMGALAFYSGFTPRVVGYTDKYIHGVLGVFA